MKKKNKANTKMNNIENSLAKIETAKEKIKMLSNLQDEIFENLFETLPTLSEKGTDWIFDYCFNAGDAYSSACLPHIKASLINVNA